MNTNFFEYKFRSHSSAEAEKILDKLKLDKPTTQNVIDTYLISDGNKTKKIYEADGKNFLITVIRKSDGFVMNQEEITIEDKDILIGQSRVDRVIRKNRKIWKLNKAEVALDQIEGLKGIFIELQGSDKRYLLKLLSILGIKKSDLINLPYNKLYY